MMDEALNSRAENTRRKIVEGGMALFFKYGHRKVTVEEICREAGVSKMTFYRFFGNKTELVKFILHELSGAAMDSYHQIMARDVPFPEKIRATIAMKQELAGRFSEEFLRDIYHDEKGEAMQILQEISAGVMQQVMDDYRMAQERGFIRKDLNLAFIPYLLNKMTEMINDPALLAIYGDMHAILKEVINLFFYGISPVDEEGAR
jgi:AcrR family transcriptional regulator